MKGVVERKAAFSSKRVVEESEALRPEVASNGCDISEEVSDLSKEHIEIVV